MSKTVMQELLDWIEDPTIKENQDKDNCIVKIKQLLIKDKQQSMDIYNDGLYLRIPFEQYYNLKFKDNEKY